MIIDHKDNKHLLIGWRETDMAKLWRISLKPDLSDLLPVPEDSDDAPEEATLKAYSAYDLPSVKALV